MPAIRPRNAIDCQTFIQENKQRIIDGIYDIDVSPDWVDQLEDSTLIFLARYCTSSSRAVAQSKRVTTDILLLLFDKPSHLNIKEISAQNLHTPKDILKVLAEDSNVNVRKQVAKNPNIPIDFLTRLARDDDPKVRQQVAMNRKTPADLLAMLSEDSTRENVNHFDEPARYQYVTRKVVAGNPNTPSYILEKLATSDDSDIRAEVAKNSASPNRLLELLIRDTHSYVSDLADKRLKELERLRKAEEAEKRRNLRKIFVILTLSVIIFVILVSLLFLFVWFV